MSLSWWWGKYFELPRKIPVAGYESIVISTDRSWNWSIIGFRYIYTGSVDVNLEIAQDLLRAADQYLLEGLKRLCEYAMVQVSSHKKFKTDLTEFLQFAIISPFALYRIFQLKMYPSCLSYRRHSTPQI